MYNKPSLSVVFSKIRVTLNLRLLVHMVCVTMRRIINKHILYIFFKMHVQN